MAPIKGISEARWIPRLGRVRLGIKVEPEQGNPYPRPVKYFVCTPEVQAVFGAEPTELRIMFPVEDEQKFAPQWYRCYSQTWGLICRGNGEVADRSFDLHTGALASRATKETVRREVPCPGPKCPEVQKRQCRPVMSLLFLLPEVPGLGVWQLDTSSFYSIRNINSGIDLARELCGRVAMVPLQLSRVPMQVTPEGEKKKTIHILFLSSHVALADIQRAAALPPGRVLLVPDTPEEDPAPEDLYPTEVLEKAEAPEASPPAPPAEAGQPPSPEDDPFALDPREVTRQQIVHLLTKGPAPTADQMAGWWDKQGWGYRLLLADMTAPFSGSVVLLSHLTAFRDALMAYREKATPAPKKEGGAT